MVIFLAQYDPASGAGFPEEVSAIAEGSITLLNAAMREAVTSGGCVWLDIHSAFVGKGPEWTFINEGDIHPNATGHYMIYRFIVEYLETGLQPGETAPEPTAASDTTLPPNTAPDTTLPPELANVLETATVPATRAATAGKECGSEKIRRRGCKGSVGSGFAFILCALVLVIVKPKNPAAARDF